MISELALTLAILCAYHTPPVVASVGTATFTLTGDAPVVNIATSANLMPASDSLGLSSDAPIVSTAYRITISAGALALSNAAPTVSITGFLYAPASATLTLTADAPDMIPTISLVPAEVDLILTPVAPTANIVVFDPTAITGNQLWLDFTDSSSVTLVSGNISQINDKSGNNRNATQTISSVRPGYSTLCPNGAHAASFVVASTNYLRTTSFSVAQPFTIFICGKNTLGGRYFHDSQSGSPRIAQLFASDSTLGTSGNFLWGWAGSGAGNGDTSVSDINKDLVSCFIGSGASSKMFVNGAQRGTTGSGSATGGISTGLFLGRNESGSLYMNGYLAHVIIYNTALSDADRQKIEGFLKTSTGISF